MYTLDSRILVLYYMGKWIIMGWRRRGSWKSRPTKFCNASLVTNPSGGGGGPASHSLSSHDANTILKWHFHGHL